MPSFDDYVNQATQGSQAQGRPSLVGGGAQAPAFQAPTPAAAPMEAPSGGKLLLIYGGLAAAVWWLFFRKG